MQAVQRALLLPPLQVGAGSPAGGLLARRRLKTPTPQGRGLMMLLP
jgi:hypothetical protein